MASHITIHGWRNDGPLFTVKTFQSGRRNRRNRWLVEDFGGDPGGRYSQQPLWYILNMGSYEVLLLNRGHEYEVTLNVDGLVQQVIVDARDDYEQFRLSSGVELLDIDVHEGDPDPDSPSLDEHKLVS